MRNQPVSSPSDRESSNALIGLRRSLWQLAIVAVCAALIRIGMSPVPGMLPVWLILLPVSALLVHYRDVFFGRMPIPANAGSRDVDQRRRAPRRQAQRSDAAARRRVARAAPAVRAKR